MNSTYAQKSSTVQKAADSKAASVFDSSAQGEALQRKADMVNNAVQRVETPRPNNTGMPDNLKAGIESLSGFSMDDVRVHYNSSKPATVQALAYTQGTDIHVAPGQEKYLPHEAWHVAQQMAGRVSPTTNINGMPVNDNAALEHEADVMGEKAVQCKKDGAGSLKNANLVSNLIQCAGHIHLITDGESAKTFSYGKVAETSKKAADTPQNLYGKNLPHIAFEAMAGIDREQELIGLYENVISKYEGRASIIMGVNVSNKDYKKVKKDGASYIKIKNTVNSTAVDAAKASAQRIFNGIVGGLKENHSLKVIPFTFDLVGVGEECKNLRTLGIKLEKDEKLYNLEKNYVLPFIEVRALLMTSAEDQNADIYRWIDSDVRDDESIGLINKNGYGAFLNKSKEKKIENYDVSNPISKKEILLSYLDCLCKVLNNAKSKYKEIIGLISKWVTEIVETKNVPEKWIDAEKIVKGIVAKKIDFDYLHKSTMYCMSGFDLNTGLKSFNQLLSVRDRKLVFESYLFYLKEYYNELIDDEKNEIHGFDDICAKVSSVVENLKDVDVNKKKLSDIDKMVFEEQGIALTFEKILTNAVGDAKRFEKNFGTLSNRNKIMALNNYFLPCINDYCCKMKQKKEEEQQSYEGVRKFLDDFESEFAEENGSSKYASWEILKERIDSGVKGKIGSSVAIDHENVRLYILKKSFKDEYGTSSLVASGAYLWNLEAVEDDKKRVFLSVLNESEKKLRDYFWFCRLDLGHEGSGKKGYIPEPIVYVDRKTHNSVLHSVGSGTIGEKIKGYEAQNKAQDREAEFFWGSTPSLFVNAFSVTKPTKTYFDKEKGDSLFDFLDLVSGEISDDSLKVDFRKAMCSAHQTAFNDWINMEKADDEVTIFANALIESAWKKFKDSWNQFVLSRT